MAPADDLREKLAWILIRQGRVLMTRNQGRELFYFPGGMREPGESDAQALVREIDEELQAAINEGSCWTCSTRPVNSHEARPLQGPARASRRMLT